MKNPWPTGQGFFLRNIAFQLLTSIHIDLSDDQAIICLTNIFYHS